MKLRGEKRRHRREQASATQDWSDSEDALVQIESQKFLADAILKLEPESRDLVVWFYFDQQSIHQISNRLSIGEAAVRQRLSRIRKRLRLHLADRFGPDWRNRILAAFPSGKVLLASLIPIMNTASWNKFIVPLAAAILFGAYALLNGNFSGKLADDVVAQAEFALAKEAELPNVRSMADEPANPSTTALDVKLENERPLWKGIVQSSEGKPIPGAVVKALQPLDRQIPGLSNWWEANDLEHSHTTSDEEGLFELRVEGNLRFDLFCAAAGFGSTRTFDFGASEWITIVLQPEAEVWGKVTDQVTGFGIANVVLKLRPGPLHTGIETFDASTNEAGEYRIRQLQAGYYTMTAFSASHPDSPNTQISIPQLLPGDRVQKDLQLGRGVNISGRVTHAILGTAVEGATVRLRSGANGWQSIADPDGYFDLRAPADHARRKLRFSAAGFGDFQYPLADGSVDGQEVFVALLPSRSAFGRIVDPSGAPVVGVSVVASSNSFFGEFGQQFDSKRAKTSKDGRFDLSDLRPDLRHSLLIVHQDYATEILDFPASELETEVIDLGTIELRPPSGVQGRVLDPNGNPIQGIYVLLSGEPQRRDDLGPVMEGGIGYMNDEGLGFGRTSCVTDARGQYSFFHLPAGNYHLSAGKKGFARRGTLEIVLSDGELMTDAGILVDRGLGIQGIVSDIDGNAVPGATVTVYQAHTFRKITYSVCDPSGNFEMWGLDPGVYRITASSGFSRSRPHGDMPWFEFQLEDIEAGTQDLLITLPRLNKLEGIVVGPDHEPVFGAIVGIDHNKNGSFAPTTSTDSKGKFALLLVEGMDYTLMAWPPVGAADGAFRPVLDGDGEFDLSLFVVRQNVTTDLSPIQLQLPKLPPLNGE